MKTNYWLTPADVVDIRWWARAGMTYSAIARAYHLSPSYVRTLCLHGMHKTVGGPLSSTTRPKRIPTDDEVMQMRYERATYLVPYKWLGLQYRISPSSACRICNYEVRKDVGGPRAPKVGRHRQRSRFILRKSYSYRRRVDQRAQGGGP